MLGKPVDKKLYDVLDKDLNIMLLGKEFEYSSKLGIKINKDAFQKLDIDDIFI